MDTNFSYSLGNFGLSGTHKFHNMIRMHFIADKPIGIENFPVYHRHYYTTLTESKPEYLSQI